MLDLLNHIPRGLLMVMTVTAALVVLCYLLLMIPSLSNRAKQLYLGACLVGAVALVYEVIYLSAVLGHH